MHSSLWMLLFHASSVCTFAMTASIPEGSTQLIPTTHFHIQFDGCFRPPRDPGFPTISHRTAVCAACVGRVVDCENRSANSIQNNNDEALGIEHEPKMIPLAVGARELPVSIETTSQHAEYEGLLMGLEWLVELISCQNEMKSYIPAVGSGGDDRNRGNPVGAMLLTIEGDCKTVIDQLSGKSKSRKLETLHRRAEELLEELGNMGTDATTTVINSISNANEGFRAEFRHIPRSQNSISDGLCNNYMSILDAKSWIGSIYELEETTNNQILEEGISSNYQTQPLSLSTVFETTARTTKFSLRLPLYEMVAKLAVETENHQLLINIGERVIEEESSLEGVQGYENSNSSAPKVSRRTATSIRKAGVGYQIRGWEGLGKAKKIKFLQRKHRVLLSNDDGNNYIISDLGKATELFPLIDDENRYCGEEVEESIHHHHQLTNLGDVTEGEWNPLLPNVWKPMLDQWFASARFETVAKIDTFLPVWVVDT